VILKLLEHSQAGVPPLNEAENTIHEKLYYQKIQPALREYLTKLRKESYIVIKPGYTDSGAVPAEQASAQKAALEDQASTKKSGASPSKMAKAKKP